MPVYNVVIEIYDSEHEYTEYNYAFAKDFDEAQRMVIKDHELDNPEYFKVHSHDEHGKPVSWEKQHDYRIYEIDYVHEAKIFVHGLHSEIDLSSCMHRPVLPLYSGHADWIWFYEDNQGDEYQYWWQQGDIVVIGLVSRGEVTIDSFNYFYIRDRARVMKTNGWKLTKGVIEDEVSDVLP